MPADSCDLLCLDVARAEQLRLDRLSGADAERGAARAAALADPTRLMIATALRDGGELCVCDLAWVTERTDNLVSHHLRRLRADGLVTSRRDGKMVMYELTVAGQRLIASVLDESAGVVS